MPKVKKTRAEIEQMLKLTDADLKKILGAPPKPPKKRAKAKKGRRKGRAKK